MKKGKKLYEGKAKIIYSTSNKNLAIQYFKDDATAFNNQKKSKIDLRQHEHYIKNGEIDFLVIITQDFNDPNNEQLSSRIVAINHQNLPKLHLKLKNFLSMK